MKVWIIKSLREGYFEDTHVFETEELARIAADILGVGFFGIETDPHKDNLEAGLLPFFVRFMNNKDWRCYHSERLPVDGEVAEWNKGVWVWARNEEEATDKGRKILIKRFLGSRCSADTDYHPDDQDSSPVLYIWRWQCGCSYTDRSGVWVRCEEHGRLP